MPSCRSRTCCWTPLLFSRQSAWLLILSIAWRVTTTTVAPTTTTVAPTTTTEASTTTTVATTTEATTTNAASSVTQAQPQLQPVANAQYSDVHGVVGAEDLSMFRKVGSGECLAPASRAVRGRARRDMTHLNCRQLCQSTCIGYTYAPCESVCTLHGDPAKITNTSDADGWATVNGGGKIDTSSKRCGANCYQRMAPCDEGEIVSNNALMTHGPMAFGSTTTLTCPLPYMGMLLLRCVLDGAILEAGRCKKPCQNGVVDSGNFDVPYPQILHGELFQAPCPQGASGTVILTCLDGVATCVRGSSGNCGNCGYDCVLGSLRAGDAVLTYPGINHMSYLNITCPNGTTGTVTVGCDDSEVSVTSGMCKYDCPEGNLSLDFHGTMGMIFYGDFVSGDENETSCEPEYNLTGELTILCHRGVVNISSGTCYRHCLPGMIGPGVKAMEHPRLEHLQEGTLKCDPGFVGDIRVRCNDSVVTIVSGECMMMCAPGSVTSNGITINHGLLNHTESVELVCPKDKYTGNLSVTCNDGAVRYAGECGLNCDPSWLQSNGAVIYYPSVPHGIYQNFTCPRPWVGYATLFCYDGVLRVVHLFCGRICLAGQKDSRGALIPYPMMNHSETFHYECQARFNTGLTFSGAVTITCDNGQAAITQGYCQADCPPGSKPYQGSTIFFDKLLAGERGKAVCGPGTPEDPLYGKVDIECSLGQTIFVGGTCGVPCLAGGFFGPQTMDTTVYHPDIPHMESRWVICPSELSGHVELYCDNGAVSAIGNGTCGARCPGRYMDVYGSIVLIPLMEHRGSLKPTCNKAGFSGYVFLECDFGGLNVTSFCEYLCPVGNVTINNGILVDHPLLQSGDLYPRNCPAAGIGSLVLKCVNGQVILHSGGCYKHCEAGWFFNPEVLPMKNSWSVSHYEILHNTSQEAECPQYYDGKVNLHCWNGVVNDTAGRCSTNCRPGRNLIRQGVVVMNREMVTGTMTNSFPCPIGFTGNLRLLCVEGVVSLGEGGCNSTCAPGVIDTAPHGELFHGDYVELACPDTGTIFVSCFDGLASFEGGKCYEGCPAGSLIDENGTVIEHSYIRHNESQAGACIGLARGNVNLFCNDTVVTQRRLPGEQCLRSCPSDPLNFSDGIQLRPPVTAHGNQATTKCPDGILGLITLRCFDTEWQVIDGACGPMNCAADTKMSNDVEVAHSEINNGWIGGPSECPAPFKGIATFSCNEGVSEVDEVTMQLPVSPKDFEAIAKGNESSDDSRFIVCGCCLPLGPPGDTKVVVENESGVYIWVLSVAGALAVIVAAIAGWYFLPKKKKVSRVWPDETTLAVKNEPRPTKEAPIDPLHYNFAKLMWEKPELAYNSEALKALPDKQQQLMIKAMQDDPKVINNFFSRRSITYITATEQNKVALAIQDKPPSARSGRVRGYQSPSGFNNNNNNLAISNVPADQLRSTAQEDVQFIVPTQQAELTMNPFPNNELVAQSPSNELVPLVNNKPSVSPKKSLS